MEFNGTFLASIISFLVFVYLMNKVLYEPMRKIVTERQNFISQNYSAAETNKQKSEALNSERDEKLSEARDEARQKYNESVSSYKNERANIVNTAQRQSVQDLEQEYENIKNVSNEAKEVLKGKMTELANDIVEKVLGYRSEICEIDNNKLNEILYNKEG